MIIHECKLSTEYFDAVKKGRKNFELRKNDRETKYQIEHVLFLREYNLKRNKYTGRHTYKKITYVLEDVEGIKDNYVILGLENIEY